MGDQPATLSPAIFDALSTSNGSSRGRRGKCDSPKIREPVAFLEKLNSVRAHALYRFDLGNHARRRFVTAPVSYLNRGTYSKLALDLDGGTVAVQVGRHGAQSKGALLAVFSGNLDRSAKRNSGAPTSCNPVSSVGACDH